MYTGVYCIKGVLTNLEFIIEADIIIKILEINYISDKISTAHLGYKRKWKHNSERHNRDAEWRIERIPDVHKQYQVLVLKEMFGHIKRYGGLEKSIIKDLASKNWKTVMSLGKHRDWRLNY